MNVKLKTRILEKYGRQWEFAKVIGLPEDQLSRIIHGRRVPTKELAEMIARLLDVTVNELWPDQGVTT